MSDAFYKNRIGGASDPDGKQFISQNRQVLDKIGQNEDGNLLFNDKLIGQALTIVNGDQQIQNGQSNQIYNNISKIVFSNAKNIILSEDGKTITIELDKFQNHIDEQKLNISYYDIKILASNIATYNAKEKEYLICDHAVDIILPQVNKMSYIKIATIMGIDEKNVVKINSTSGYINQKNCTELILDIAYSSVELVYNFASNIWMILTPFVPVQTNIIGLDQLEQRKLIKKNNLLFG